jgi:aristolochene synthase
MPKFVHVALMRMCEYFSLLLAMQRFQQDLHLSSEELASVADIEKNYTHHISAINDIMSWDKEYKTSRESASQGAIVSSMVQVLTDEANLGYDAARRVLWTMVREWENQHDELVTTRIKKGNCSTSLIKYMEGIKMQMCGNELWSRWTSRYNLLA